MRARFVLASFLLVAVSAASCAGQVRPTLEDSRGVLVEWECSSGTCEVTASSTPPPMCADLPNLDLFVLGASAFALLCGASVIDHALALHEESCRPIRCADESGCPQWDDRRYACADGLCRTTSRALDMLDVTALCLASVDRPATCPAVASDAATSAGLLRATGACSGTACTIPEVCLP